MPSWVLVDQISVIEPGVDHVQYAKSRRYIIPTEVWK